MTDVGWNEPFDNFGGESAIMPCVAATCGFALNRTITNKQGETMPTMIFVNLPVKDLNRTVEFFTKLGFKFNPQFTDEYCHLYDRERDHLCDAGPLKQNSRPLRPKQSAMPSKAPRCWCRLHWRAGKLWKRWYKKLLLPADQPTLKRATTASCTNTDSRIWTAYLDLLHGIQTILTSRI